MAEQKGFAIPEHTQTPNSFFDVTLPQIKSIGELKVLLAIMRQTFGWRKFSDTISMSQLVKITGLSRQGVVNGLQLGLEHGFIQRTARGQSFSYSLKLVKQVDQSNKLTSQEDRPELVKQVDRKLVKQVDTQKTKKKEKKETTGAHVRLMAFHDSKLPGGMPDGGAQGAAVKWLLERFTPEQCEVEYLKLAGEEWRTTPVTWLTVKKHIGGDLARRAQIAPNGHSPAGEKILQDYGDWYTVMGVDGTPSKRYRTADAFARETGRDVEEVRAKWN